MAKPQNYFGLMIDYYRSCNDNFLFKKTLYYLTAQEDFDTFNNMSQHFLNYKMNFRVLNLSQVGLLYSLSKNNFAENYFDDKLLNFFSKYRTRVTFVFKETHKSIVKHNLHLKRIHVTDASKEERIEINKFMADNLECYTKFVRQTTEDHINHNVEKILDLDHMNKIYPNKKDYKDLTLLFG